MPGVPTYRGCNACRKQKKKCDMASPACSRCARLKIPCIGCGQLRYKFRDQSSIVKSSGETQRKSPSPMPPPPTPLTAPLSSQTSTTAGAFVSLLEISDPKYDLAWFGSWFKQLPQRLGHNEALDAAVEAMAAFYPHFRDQEMSRDSVVKYVTALETLRTSLNDPKKAAMLETLCAIYILMICQGWAGRHGDQQMSHGEGLAHLLDTVTLRGQLDNIETPIRDTLCVPVVLEGIYNPRIRFPAWFSTIQSESIGPSPLPDEANQSTMRLVWISLVKVPDLVREPIKFMPEIAQLYQRIRADIPLLKQTIEQSNKHVTSGAENDPEASEAARSRIRGQISWGLLLLSAMIFNGYLRALGADDGYMATEADSLANDVISLAENAAQYRPLGASYIPNCLIPAWAITENTDIKKRVVKTLESYRTDFTPIVSKSWYIIAIWMKAELDLARFGLTASGLENYHSRSWGTVKLNEEGDPLVDGIPRNWFDE